MRLIFSLVLLVVSASAQAQVFKHVDGRGEVTYSNEPKGGVKLDLRPALEGYQSSTPSSAEVQPNRSRQPLVSPGYHVPLPLSALPQVKSSKIDISNTAAKLDAEIAIEQEALDKAKTAVDEGAANPETFQTKVNGATVVRRNVAAFEEKMRILQADVIQHNVNLDRLHQERDVLNVPLR